MKVKPKTAKKGKHKPAEDFGVTISSPEKVMFPEAGGSSSFARHAFNELVSFIAGWSIVLDYTILLAVGVATFTYPLVWYVLHRWVLHSRWMFKVPVLASTWKRIHYDHHQDPNHLEVLFGALHTTLPTIALGVIPIINENDTISTDELVKVRLLLDSTLPVIRRRTARISAELEQGRRLQQSQRRSDARSSVACWERCSAGSGADPG